MASQKCRVSIICLDGNSWFSNISKFISCSCILMHILTEICVLLYGSLKGMRRLGPEGTKHLFILEKSFFDLFVGRYRMIKKYKELRFEELRHVCEPKLLDRNVLYALQLLGLGIHRTPQFCCSKQVEANGRKSSGFFRQWKV